MTRNAALLLSLSVPLFQVAAARAQTVRTPVHAPAAGAGISLAPAAIGISLVPSLGLKLAPAAQFAPAAIPVLQPLPLAVSPAVAQAVLPAVAKPAPAAVPVLQAVPLAVSPAVAKPAPAAVPVLQAVPLAVSPAVAQAVSPVLRAARAAAARISSDESVRAAVRSDSSRSERAAALGKVFDGGLGDGAPAVSAAGLGGGLGGVEARDFSSGYGLYSWLSGMPEIASLGKGASLGAARVLLAVNPLLERGPIFVMKEGPKLTAMSVKDPETPPVVVGLSAAELGPEGASAQAVSLAKRIETAQAADKAEGTFFNTAAVMNNLGQAARAPAPELERPRTPGIVTGAELPLDPQRQPGEYVGRMLRDAARSSDPYEVLDILKKARAEALARLNYQDASKLIEGAFRQGEFQARELVPGLLEAAQQAASVNDKAGVGRALDAALAFCEYAPNLKKKVVEAYGKAHTTLQLIKDFGQIDPETGLPVAKDAPEQAPRPAALETR